MLGVEGYGSDSDNASDSETTPQVSTATSSASITSRLPAPAKKSTFALPPPSSSASSSKASSGLALPPPKTRKAPKKIAIGLPSLSKDDDRTSDTDDRPLTKKARLESGAGASGLLSMLPAPKNKVPIAPAAERVLGGGRGPGLVFKATPSASARTTTVEDAEEDSEEEAQRRDVLDSSHSSILEEKIEKKVSLPKASIPFMPTSVARGKANVSVEEKHSAPVSRPPAPAVDFFSLGNASSSSSRTASALPSISAAPPISSKPAIHVPSAAPQVEDFVAPEPTPTDPYPGYYLLPSGQWAAYEPTYYKKFYDKWKREYDAHVRALEKGKVKGFEDLDAEGLQEVNAFQEMEKAKKEVQELEERKALTNGTDAAPEAPKMNIKGAALGGRARTRHQLSTLLTEAYQNREALEERIAQGRKNRKEAGNKYGF